MKKPLMFMALPILTTLDMSFDVNLMQDLQDMDDSKVGQCSKCERWTWDENELGILCGMPQPDLSVCDGRFVKEKAD